MLSATILDETCASQIYANLAQEKRNWHSLFAVVQEGGYMFYRLEHQSDS
jgi:hypothetical protein